MGSPSDPENASKRRVAKTLIEGATVPDRSNVFRRAVAKTILEATVLPESGQTRRISGKRQISRTLLELSLANKGSEAGPLPVSAPDQTNPVNENDRDQLSVQASPHPSCSQYPPQAERYVAKTMLDHCVLLNAVSKSAARKEQLAAELARQQVYEPAKESDPVQPVRLALACSWTWDDKGTRDRVRYCGVCQTQVYNFEGMDNRQARAFVFERENLGEPKFFRRPDGKYMTKNCPIALAKRRRRILMTIGSLFIAIGAVACLVAFPPQVPIGSVASPEPKELPGDPGLADRGLTGLHKNGSDFGEASSTQLRYGDELEKSKPNVLNEDVSVHYEVGKPLQVNRATPATTGHSCHPVPEKQDQDENGQFWQFAPGQNAEIEAVQGGSQLPDNAAR